PWIDALIGLFLAEAALPLLGLTAELVLLGRLVLLILFAGPGRARQGFVLGSGGLVIGTEPFVVVEVRLLGVLGHELELRLQLVEPVDEFDDAVLVGELLHVANSHAAPSVSRGCPRSSFR